MEVAGRCVNRLPLLEALRRQTAAWSPAFVRLAAVRRSARGLTLGISLELNRWLSPGLRRERASRGRLFLDNRGLLTGSDLIAPQRQSPGIDAGSQTRKLSSTCQADRFVSPGTSLPKATYARKALPSSENENISSDKCSALARQSTASVASPLVGRCHGDGDRSPRSSTAPAA